MRGGKNRWTREGVSLWTEEEDQILENLVAERPLDSRTQIFEAARKILPHRTEASIFTRILISRVKDARAAALAKLEEAEAANRVVKPAKATIIVSATPSSSETCNKINITIPAPPFPIEPTDRRESRPYERRTNAYTRREAESPYHLFKRILMEEMRP